jgi:succinyl-diaminopimelate desuccinylase
MDTVETLLWLCQIPSPTGHEGPIADELLRRLKGLPHLEAMSVRRHGNSIVVDLITGRSAPKIALVGHTDVVPTAHDGPARIDGNRLYGPGASDMKSGLALMLSVAEQPDPEFPNLTLVFYAGEEGPFDGNELERVIENEPALQTLDFALVLEPTDNQLQLGCGGTIHAEFIFSGTSAHSARPWQGDNAIYKSLGVLERLKNNVPESRLVEGLEWKKSMSCTMARGGRAPNVICDEFVLNVNARFAPDQDRREIELEFEALAQGEARVKIVDCSPPAAPRRSHPLVRLLEKTGRLVVAPKFGWTDVARFSACGVAAANFGPGTLSQAHQRNEWTSIAGLCDGERILRQWLKAAANPSS